VLEGKVTKVVSFGAFVEIMEGVEGLVHISELAQHHVENPREVVEPGDEVKVKILEIDEERRRLSLSLKRVEGQVLEPKDLPPSEGDEEMGAVPDLGLSEEVFAPDGEAPVAPEAAEVAEEPVTDVEPVADEPAAEGEPAAEAAPELSAEAAAEPEQEAAAEPAAEEQT